MKLHQSALLPGQPIVTPAAHCAAMMVIIKLAFKAMFHVVYVIKSVFDEQLASFLGTVAAATDEYHRNAIVFG